MAVLQVVWQGSAGCSMWAKAMHAVRRCATFGLARMAVLVEMVKVVYLYFTSWVKMLKRLAPPLPLPACLAPRRLLRAAAACAAARCGRAVVGMRGCKGEASWGDTREGHETRDAPHARGASVEGLPLRDGGEDERAWVGGCGMTGMRGGRKVGVGAGLGGGVGVGVGSGVGCGSRCRSRSVCARAGVGTCMSERGWV